MLDEEGTIGLSGGTGERVVGFPLYKRGTMG